MTDNQKVGVIGGEDCVFILIEGKAITNDTRQMIESSIRAQFPECTVTIQERISAF
jgi:hypothetical protein